MGLTLAAIFRERPSGSQSPASAGLTHGLPDEIGLACGAWPVLTQGPSGIR